MALTFTTAQAALLRSANIKARLFTTWYMDTGTYFYCDDVYDMAYDGNVYIGANAIASAGDIKTGSGGMTAESVTLSIDGARLNEAGMDDPAELFQMILGLPLANRRVDLSLGLGYPDDQEVTLMIPLYQGKINSARLVEQAMTFGDPSASQTQSTLEIVLDSWAARYNWVAGRTRTHEDQHEIDPDDDFFSFVNDNLRAESTLYWGKKSPEGVNTTQSTQQIVQTYGTTSFR